MEENRKNDEVRETRINAVGVMQGVPPGKFINAVTVLDLRGVPAEQVAGIKRMDACSVVLVDENNCLALNGVSMNAIGSLIVTSPETRVMVTAHMDISRSGIEAMPGGQKLLVVGNVFFKPDVPQGMVSEKIERLQVVGLLIACEGVYGALLGKMQMVNGLNVILPDDVGPVHRLAGETRLTSEFLAQLGEGTTLVNIGKAEVYPDVSPELLRHKVAAYYNAGETSGPAASLAVLQARCSLNVGRFRTNG